MADYVTILGARGSLPVSGPEYDAYGGATTCVLVRLDGKTALLDAGTGLMSLPEAAMALPALPLLLSHAHADHLLALGLCPYVMRPGRRLDVYVKERGELDGAAQAGRLFSPPLWPVGLDALPAEIRFHPLESGTEIGGIRVDAIEGDHPGGVSLLRLSAGGKSVAFLTDCAVTEENLPAYARFARGCDLLLVDGQYSPQEWQTRKDFGHSAWTMAARLAKESGAAAARVIHHDPGRTDAMLDAAAAEVAAVCPGCAFARRGETIPL